MVVNTENLRDSLILFFFLKYRPNSNFPKLKLPPKKRNFFKNHDFIFISGEEFYQDWFTGDRVTPTDGRQKEHVMFMT